jgi:enoyl-CoA hydratase/carnithine racemase
MTFETIIYEAAGEDGVATVTINRPDVLNAFDHQMVGEFAEVWRLVREDAAARAVVLRAAGNRAFSTGADVKKGGYSRAEIGPFDQDDPGAHLGPKQNRVWKPVVTAVHGLCAGGAFHWINESDIVICSPEAQFFDPHVTYGMVTAVEPIGALARMPLAEVVRMSLMGNDERISAETALRISLVTEIAERDALWTRAHEIAAIIAAKPAAAIQGSVRAIWEAQDLPRSAAVSNALKYCQLGNPIGRAEVDRWSVPKARWKLR